LKFVFQDKGIQDLLDGSLVFLHELFFVDSLNRAVLGAKLMDYTVSEMFLRHFIGNVNYLAWPGPSLAKYNGITVVHDVHND